MRTRFGRFATFVASLAAVILSGPTSAAGRPAPPPSAREAAEPPGRGEAAAPGRVELVPLSDGPWASNFDPWSVVRPLAAGSSSTDAFAAVG